MLNTYKNFRELSKLHTGETNLDQLAIAYQEDESPITLAHIFCDQYAYIVSQVNKYFYLTESDKASFAVEELHKALKDFQEGKGAGVRTLFSRYLNRRLYAETNMLNHQKRCANTTALNFTDMKMWMSKKGDEPDKDEFALVNDLVMGKKEEFTDEVDMMLTIESSGIFTDNEVKYCKIIMQDSEDSRDSDVARMLKVSPSAINQMKKSIKKKFVSLSLATV